MSDEQLPHLPEAAQKKEQAVLTNDSLNNLAKEVQSKGMVLAMYLNIPTTRLVNMRLEATEKNKSPEAMCVGILHYWKEMRASAKDKDKVMDLDRALKEAGFVEIAEILIERSKDNMELTPDCFPSA